MNDHNLSVINNINLEFPKGANGQKYHKFLESSLSHFLNTIAQFEGKLGISVMSKFEEIELNCNLLAECIQSIIANNDENNFCGSFLDSMKERLRYQNLLLSETFMDNNRNNWYRIRASPKKTILKRSELFHVPFEVLRNADNSDSFANRFSDGSTPMLYLANSMYLAWKECRSPDIADIYAARFEFDRNLNVLYIPANSNAYFSPINFISSMKKAPIGLNLDLNKIQNSPYRTDIGFDELINFLCLWPILFTLSIPNNKCNSNQEYLFPQHFIKWLSSTMYDGIAFASSRNSEEMSTQDWEINLALPAVAESSNGYCSKLCNSVKLTNPIRIQELENYMPKNHELLNKRMQIPNQANYASTIYCKAEYFLDDDEDVRTIKESADNKR